MVHWSNALHLSARGVTTVPGLIPGCITSGRDWETHEAAHNWPSVIRVRVWPGEDPMFLNVDVVVTDKKHMAVLFISPLY